MARHNLCEIDVIPESGSRGFALDGTDDASIFVVRRAGDLFVYQNRCPHLGLPLEWMPHQFLDRDGQYIQCATHGALFAIDSGKCVTGPCLGENLAIIPFKIEGKSIIIDTVDPEKYI